MVRVWIRLVSGLELGTTVVGSTVPVNLQGWSLECCNLRVSESVRPYSRSRNMEHGSHGDTEV